MTFKYLSKVFITVCLLMAGCKEEVLVSITDIIKFDLGNPVSVAADNISVVNIKVIIPKNASSDSRNVSFQTDLGSFNNGSDTFTAVADQDGLVNAYLKSDKLGVANVTATIKSYSISTQVTFIDPLVKDVIAFVDLDEKELIADNLDNRQLLVKVDSRIPERDRTVIFKTDIGTFTNDLQTISVLANSEGSASTILKADKIGKATITASVGSFTISTQLELVAQSPDSIFTVLPLASTQLFADGVSTATLQVQIDKRLTGERRNVAFSTVKGEFQSASGVVKSLIVVPDANGVASATLSSTDEGEAPISILHRDLVKKATVIFGRSLPDQLRLQIPFTMKAGLEQNIEIHAKLSRRLGTFRNGFNIEYSAKDSSDNAIGIFQNNTISDNNGNASVLFSTGRTDYRGKVTIRARITEVPTVQTFGEIVIVDP